MIVHAISTAEALAIPGGVLALLGIFAVVWRLLKAAHRAASRLERIEEMAQELKPNGGGSIKDTVHRIDARLAKVEERQDAQDRRIARTEGRVDAIVVVPPVVAPALPKGETDEPRQAS